jgi:error-prone DNA polymerase
MEDETGIASVIITPDLYARERVLVTQSRFLMTEGPLLNLDA